MLHGVVALIIAIVATVVTVITPFGAAYYAAWLQRKWTPDPIPAIKDVESRVREVRERIEGIECDREEREGFTLGMRLQQAQASPNSQWILVVKNDTDSEVLVRSVQLFRDNAPLSSADKPSKPDDWRIPVHSQKPISWVPETNPIIRMRFAGTEPHRSPPIPGGLSVYPWQEA